MEETLPPWGPGHSPLLLPSELLCPIGQLLATCGWLTLSGIKTRISVVLTSFQVLNGHRELATSDLDSADAEGLLHAESSMSSAGLEPLLSEAEFSQRLGGGRGKE